MNRNFLKGLLGEHATKEIIDEILNEAGKDIESEKAKYNDLKAQLDKANETISERDSQLETLKNSTGDVETLKQQIATLQSENEQAKTAHDNEIKQLRIDNAIDKALSDAKCKNTKATRALLDLANAELLEDGTVKGLKEMIDALVKAEDSKMLFDTSKPDIKLKGTNPANSNPNPNSNRPDSQKSYLDFVAEMTE